MSDSKDDVYVAIAALVIAIAALIAASLQIAQAMLASARGLPNCNKAVIGEWAQQAKPKLNPWELRLEVFFTAPVIFLAPQKSEAKPVKGEEVWQAEGTERSCQKSRISWQEVCGDDRANNDGKDGKERVHTVENERASWISLLVAIERMERDSKDWEAERQKPANKNFSNHQHPEPSLTIKMQRIRRRFDTYSSIKRPYATTTISHLVELAAVLGLYWKVFNQDNDKYRAEGNGFNLLGYRMPDFGVVFTFEKTGKCVFDRRRVIPTSEVKELCFGRVPTLYRRKVDPDEDTEWHSSLKTSSGSGLKVEILQLGSRDEIAETLTEIGCNVGTTLYYKEARQHQHLFPVTFELMGMLARSLYIKNRCFRFLPNPSIFPWNGDSLSFRRLLQAFSQRLNDNCRTITEQLPESQVSEEVQVEVNQIRQLAKDTEDLSDKIGQKVELNYPQLNDIYDAIQKADTRLDVSGRTPSGATETPPKATVRTSGERDTHSDTQVVELDVLGQTPDGATETSPQTTISTSGEGETRLDTQEVVLDVLRRHVQEVLSAINREKPGQSEEPSMSFEVLRETPPERREERFMEIYFVRILWRVIHVSASSSEEHHDDGDQERVSRAIHEGTVNRRQSVNQHANEQGSPTGDASRPSAQTTPTDASFHHSDRHPTPLQIRARTLSMKKPTARSKDWDVILQEPYEMRRLKIWYTLVFRMICWLMLHDFDKRDVQLPSVDVMGSRQPVFIM